MSKSKLTAFWFEYPGREGTYVGPVPEVPGKNGIGVTAFSIEDAQQLLAGRGYDIDLHSPEVSVRSGMDVNALPDHVRRHMGPAVARGVWYPALNVGF